MSSRNLSVVDNRGLVRINDRDYSEARDCASVKGLVVVELWNEYGELKDYLELTNLVTLVGNQYWAERASGIGSPPAQATGMRLGTGTTAVASTGAGSFIGTYITGSNTAGFSSGPTSSNPSGGIRRITFVGSWAAGVATNSAIAEAVVTNETPITNVQGAAANTIARVLLSPTINKGASDTLALTWQFDLGS